EKLQSHQLLGRRTTDDRPEHVRSIRATQRRAAKYLHLGVGHRADSWSAGKGSNCDGVVGIDDCCNRHSASSTDVDLAPKNTLVEPLKLNPVRLVLGCLE